MMYMFYLKITFANGKSHEDSLYLSETHQIAFQKNNIDFFMITIDDMGDTEVKLLMINICMIFF